MKKYFFMCFVVAALLVSGCQAKIPNESLAVTGDFEFTVLKAGQADAIILKTTNHSVIIDCGEKDDGDKVVKYLEENNISNVDYFFVTHFDKDHVGGFSEVMESITTNNIAVPDYEGSNGEYKKYLKTIEEKKLNVIKLQEDMSFYLDDVFFEVSVPQKKSYAEGDNDYSLVISVTHGENTFLFAGDAEAERLTEVISKFGYGHDFLKVPHHGKYNKNTERFIKIINPKYSVITDSEKNPAEEKTLSYLDLADSEIYSTKNGNVSVFSDGKEIRIIQ